MINEKFEKYLQIFEMLAVILAAVLLAIFKFYPEYKKSVGSSDAYYNFEECDTIVEIELEYGPDIMLTTVTSEKINNIFFLNTESLIFYNKNIENATIEKGINKIIDILHSNDYLNEDQKIKIIKYQKSENYDIIKEKIVENVSTLSKSIEILEQEEDFNVRVKKLDITEENELNQLKMLDAYSKSFIREYKNKSMIDKIGNTMSLSDADTYADEVYNKLVEYSKNVVNQEKNSPVFPIQLISVGKNDNIYVSSNSWYYIKNHQVYAFIEFSDNNYTYTYCYNGTIDQKEKGECYEKQ